MRRAPLIALTAALALPLTASAVDPTLVQARYDAARDAEERELRSDRPDWKAVRRARARIAWAERIDKRPRSWRRARGVPVFPLRGTRFRARGARTADQVLAARLGALGRSYRGWAAFWVHDLTSGAAAGWNADARFPGASTVKLGALVAALRGVRGRPAQSPLWYDLRQLTGWSSNLAANRVEARLGRAAVTSALRRLGMRSSTYPGPYRVGSAVALDAPRPPPHGHLRVTTAHDLGRAFWSLQAAAAGNRWKQRTTGLTAGQARLALGLLATGSHAGLNRGLVAPYVGRAAVAQKVGWLSDTRATAGIVYLPSGPKIVVVLVYRPGITNAEALRLGRRAVVLARDDGA